MATKTTGSEQIKSRKRVKEHGEVFTNPREVKAMCDLVGNTLEWPDTTVLEPACGSGNFLAEILERKLKNVTYGKMIETEKQRQQAVLAVASLYGVDIMEDNVKQTRDRLFGIAAKYILCNLSVRFFKDEMLHKTLIDCQRVLYYNIKQGDFLKDNLDFQFWRFDVLLGTDRISLHSEHVTKEQIMKEEEEDPYPRKMKKIVKK